MPLVLVRRKFKYAKKSFVQRLFRSWIVCCKVSNGCVSMAEEEKGEVERIVTVALVLDLASI